MRNTDSTDAALGCLATIILIPISLILNGLVLSTLWGWFIVPIFNLPGLSIGYAIGLGLIVGYLRYQEIDTGKKEEKAMVARVTEATVTIIARPAVAFLSGWIIHMFV